MPSLSPTMTEGSIVQWNKKEGEEVHAGDVLCEVQTDKAVVALECEEDGILAKIVVGEKSQNVQIGAPIAVIASPDENWEEIKSSVVQTSEPSVTDAKAVPSTPAKGDVQPTESPAQTSFSSKLGPAARLLLDSHGLDASQIPASGPRGYLLKEDVLSYLKTHPDVTSVTQPLAAAPAVQPVPVGPTSIDVQAPHSPGFTDIPLTNIRQTIAKRLTQSKSTIPHSYIRSVATLDRVSEIRRVIKSHNGPKLSVNDLLVKACALSLRLVPELNAISDPSSGSCVSQSTVDICMAVATPAGLIAPILRDADRTPISQLSILATHLAKRARDGKLQPHEFQGGTFTISNLGMFAIREFTAIINLPQVAILAVGSGFEKPVNLSGDSLEKLHFASRMIMTLSIDSRFVDSVAAGRFLTHVSRLISDHPELLLADDPKAMSALKPDSVKPDIFDATMVASMTPQLTLTL